jgi:ABC-2 type transport system permease protein
MSRLTRVELLKIRSTRTAFGLLAATVGITALITLLDAARSGGKFTPPLSTSAGLSFVITITGFALLMALILGIIVSSGEFRHGTATVTYLATPNRLRVLVAKALASFAIGTLFGAAGAATATAVGIAFAATKGDAVAVGAATMIRFGVGAMVGAGLVAGLGTGIGTLIRSQLAGVVGALVWCLLMESILGGVAESLGPYLPFTAATTLGGSKPAGGDIGFYSSGSIHPLPFVAAAALVTGIALLISALAAGTTVRADIT